MYDDLLDLLESLDGVPQDPRHHPEGDALYHALQVFKRARLDTDDGALLAAALFHDVGKASGGRDHEVTGAADLEGLLPRRATWLVRHHMDLLRDPHRAQRELGTHPWFPDLVRLRRWDKDGRDPRAVVPSPEEAVGLVVDRLENPKPGGRAAYPHDSEDPQ